MNDTELARNIFNPLFAAHDAKDIRTATEEKLLLKTIKKETNENVELR